MTGFCRLVQDVLAQNGVPSVDVFTDAHLELPGYFRPTKQWDMLVVSGGRLIAALEFKSQRGPSFGNNFNNRTEEAIGTAQDLWTAYREKAFGTQVRPWLGWVMLLEDCPKSNTPVGVNEPHFSVFEEFRGASYTRRYELLLHRLVLEKLFDGAVFLTATSRQGRTGVYSEPVADLGMRPFLAALVGHALAVQAGRQ
jgi:type II restriction enzyme